MKSHKTYIRILRLCQTGGRKLGNASRLDGVWSYYEFAGMQYRFQRGRYCGPEKINAGLCWAGVQTTHTTTV